MVDASSLVISGLPRRARRRDGPRATRTTGCTAGAAPRSRASSPCASSLLLLAHPEANAVVVRRFSNTLRDSVFQQMTWAIAELGLEGWFRARILADGDHVPAPRGQRIVFRGADDPLKLKGVKFTRGYCAVVWFEELDQFGRDRRGAVDPELAAPRRRGLLDLLQLQPAADAVELGEPRGAGARAAGGHAGATKLVPGRRSRATRSGWARPSTRRPSTCAASTSGRGRNEYLGRGHGDRGLGVQQRGERGACPTRRAGASRARETAWTGAGSRTPWRFVRCGWEPGRAQAHGLRRALGEPEDALGGRRRW